MSCAFVVIMDPLDRADPELDTSVGLLRAALEAGHRVWWCGPADLTVVDGTVVAEATPLGPSTTALGLEADGGMEVLDLARVDAVLVRVDPPVDASYLAMTLVLEMLRGRTLVWNDPRGLREANEKLYAAHFPTLVPPMLVSADRDRLLDFAQQHGRAVVKPLDGHGGRGVHLLDPGDPNERAILDSVTEGGRRLVMVQRFLDDVYRGDRRLLLLEGEPLGAILRVPNGGDFRANIGRGGSVVATEMTDRDREIASVMAPRLVADGLAFVGVDVIGGFVTEVNVTSPTGLRQLVTLGAGRPDLEIITALERAVLHAR